MEQTSTFFKSVLNSIEDFVLVKDSNSNILWANSSFLDAYGMSQKELAELVDSNHSDPDDTLQYVKDDAKVVALKQSLQVIEPVTHHCGQVHQYDTIKTPIIENDRVTKIVGVSRLISNEEKILSSIELKGERTTFIDFQKNFFSSLQIPALLLDAQHRVVTASFAFLEIFKLNRGQIKEHPFHQLIADNEHDECSEPNYFVEKHSFELEINGIKAVGDLIITPWNIDRDSIGGHIVFFKDQTAQLALESLLQIERQQSIISDRIQSLGELSAGVAHEVNNPLSIMMGTLEKIKLINSPESLSLSLVKDLQSIEKNCERIAGIVKGLKAMSRDSREDDFVSVSIKKILSDVLSLFEGNIRHQEIDLIIDYKTDFNLMCRPGEISQVLYNLISNAIDEIKEQKTPWIKIFTNVKSDRAYLCVQDSGNGISPEVESKLFDPFFSTKELGKGTGLGLGICTKIVTNHGGQIYLDKSFQNTTFTMRFTPC